MKNRPNLTCRSINREDLDRMADFTVRKEGGFLANYLAYRSSDGKIYSPALYNEENSRARTYIVENQETSEIIAYFTLKAGMVGIKQKSFPLSRDVDAVPGIEVANLAVNESYKKRHENYHGIGYMVFEDFVLPKVKEVSNIIGVKILYIFALPHKELIEHYKSYGFFKLPPFQQRHIEKWFQPSYDRDCVFMYQTLQ